MKKELSEWTKIALVVSAILLMMIAVSVVDIKTRAPISEKAMATILKTCSKSLIGKEIIDCNAYYDVLELITGHGDTIVINNVFNNLAAEQLIGCTFGLSDSINPIVLVSPAGIEARLSVGDVIYIK